MRTTQRLLLAVLVLATACGASNAEEPDWAKIHDPLDQFLAGAVKDGVVLYGTLKKREAALDGYLKTLAAADPKDRPEAERLAYWINAYNAFTLKLILRKYPDLKSIKDLKDPWTTVEWRAAGKVFSLDQIEHEVLRKEFKEPRIHFALVCAAFSCPDLSPKAYRGADLDEQLGRATRMFLANQEKGFRIVPRNADEVKVEVSKIFEWFEEDFEKSAGSILNYLIRHVPRVHAETLRKNRKTLKIAFKDYDWKLNGR